MKVSLIVPKDLPTSLGAFQSGVFFRGLRRDGEININQLQGGRRTVIRLPRYGAPRVRVIRERVEPERLLLVLDCSRSKRGEDTAGTSRLRIAKEAIFEFLNNMDSDGEIGLVLFGDRYGFEEKSAAGGKNQIFPVRVGNALKLPVQAVDAGQIKDFGLIVANEDVAHNPNFVVRSGVPVNPLDERQRAKL